MSASRDARLRASLIWHDEVMADVVLDERRALTLGSSTKSTFVIPDLGLPAEFALLRRGGHGYVLTLGANMRGTVRCEGKVQEVESLIGAAKFSANWEGFLATPVAPGDWGVIELDGDGALRVFFQFVEPQPPLATSRTALELLLPALAFSAILHLAFLITVFVGKPPESPFVWPGPRSLTGNYLATHLKPEEPPPPPPPPTPGVAAPAAPAPKTGQVKNVRSAPKGDEGKSGGEGKTERARDPNARDVPAVPPPQVAFLTKQNRSVLDNVIHSNTSTDLDKYYTGIKGDLRRGSVGNGAGTGNGVGDDLNGTGATRGSTGKGSGAGGNVDGEYVVKKGPIDAGEVRAAKGTGGEGTGPREVSVKPGTASGDFGSLTREEIDKVVRARANLIRACYQRELNRKRGLSGKLVVNFVIAADGAVKSTRIDPGSSLRDEDVERCARAIITKLRFPAKGGGIVNYPFLFSQGS
ncbi:MAG: AgmX/PglI C-terminal domain-containing protein [Kofleriaceae bacterium]